MLIELPEVEIASRKIGGFVVRERRDQCRLADE